MGGKPWESRMAVSMSAASFLRRKYTGLKLEARVGIEPTHKGFADLSLTTWVPRPELQYLLALALRA